MNEMLELACPECSWCTTCGPPAMLQWLTRAAMVRRDVGPEPELLAELLRAAGPKLTCPQCGIVGLTVREAEDNDDDEFWGMGRSCDGCGKPIARERLEIFPNTRLCVTCQESDDRGETSAPAEYCPKCGNVMTLRPSRGAGLTRYVQACPSCGASKR